MRSKLLLFHASCCAAFLLALQAQSGSESVGFAVSGWSGVAPDYPIVTVRDVAAAPEGFYVAADVSSTYGQIGVISDVISDVYVARFDSAGALAWSAIIAGAGRDRARAIAVDQTGYVYVAGSTRSADFPRLNSLEAGIPDGSQAAFLWKIDPATGAVVYSTVFGGSVPSADRPPVESEALDVAVDADGVAYVTGWTNSQHFPVSVEAFDTDWQGQTGFGPSRTAFVAKFAPDGTLLYATYLGGEERNCSGGSNCIPVVPYTEGIRIALGPAGGFFVAGVTNTTDFPVSGGAFQTQCHCSRGVGDAFVARFAPDGRTLEYATYLGGSPYGDSVFPYGAEGLTDLAVDSSGSAYIVGWTSAPDYPTTVGAVQPDFHGEGDPANFEFAGLDGFAAKLSPNGGALEYSTFLGGFGEDRVVALALRFDGSAILSGVTASDDFPLTPGFLERGKGFLATLSANGATVDFSTRQARRVPDWPTPEGVAVFSADQQRLAIAGGGGIVTYLEHSGPDRPAVWALAGAADSGPSRHISPGELISLYGVRIGPDQPVSFELDDNGRVPLELAGIRVLFNGTGAPVLYAQRDQVNIVAPFGLERRGEATIQLLREGSEIGPLVTPTRPVSPGIFPVGQTWALVNADGTLNTPESPAAYGSVVAAWATGAGTMSPSPVDGSVATRPLSTIDRPVRVILDYDEKQAEVRYAGAAPGLVQGVVQINFRIPPKQNPFSQAIPMVVEIEGVRSPLVFVHVREVTTL